MVEAHCILATGSGDFRAVSLNEKLPPQTIKDKFVTGTLDSFDYSAFIFVALQAGFAQAHNATPEFHQGAAGYGRYYWHTYADYVNENLWVEFLLPAALHQDSRYYTLGRGSFTKRLGYSLSRAAITHPAVRCPLCDNPFKPSHGCGFQLTSPRGI